MVAWGANMEISVRRWAVGMMEYGRWNRFSQLLPRTWSLFFMISAILTCARLTAAARTSYKSISASVLVLERVGGRDGLFCLAENDAEANIWREMNGTNYLSSIALTEISGELFRLAKSTSSAQRGQHKEGKLQSLLPCTCICHPCLTPRPTHCPF